MMKKGFTLAEVLITLAIIGVVAALTIPSVIVNAREQGNITAFKKAVSVLNSAISLSVAVDSAGPSATVNPANADTSDADNPTHSLVSQLGDKMNVISQGYASDGHCAIAQIADSSPVNAANTCWFTTADGMQFIAADKASGATGAGTCTDASSNVTPTNTGTCPAGSNFTAAASTPTFACTQAAPCYLVVDVNGTAQPNKFSDWTQGDIKGHVSDRFVVTITDENAQAAGAYEQAVMAK